MEFSDLLATLALAVSILSAWLSHKSSKRTTELSEGEQRREFSRERSEFLVRIERSTKQFEKAEKRLLELLEEFRQQPESVQSAHKIDIVQLENDLKYLEGCLRQSSALWVENFETSPDGMAHHRPRHLSLIEDDEQFVAEALARADKSEESLSFSLMLKNPIIG